MRHDGIDGSRRDVLKVMAVGASAGGLATLGRPVAAQDDDLADWLSNVGNADEVVDRTGQEEVTVEVGAGENALAFDPPAVQIDPGTRVVWEWTGEGGQHNVVVQDHDVESPLQEEEGVTYALDFDGTGIVTYVCAPHEAAGMKGAVVVGEPTPATGVDWLRTGLVGLAGGIVAAPFVASEVLARRREGEEKRGPERTAD